MSKSTRNFVLGVLIVLFFFNILAWIAVFDLSRPQLLEVNFFDVGQGDAIFIETPQRHQILIDGGPSSKILEKLGGNMPFWDRDIDLIILTHPDTDHLRGLIEIFKKYKIEKILWTGIVKDTPEYKEWEARVQNQKFKIFIAKAGQRIKTSKVYSDILWPMENLEGKIVKNDDNTSIVIKLIFNARSFLFTGDIDKSVEMELIEKYDIDSDVLKVAHHGSKTSTSEEFLGEVLPEIAIIQVGENKYGHPYSEVLERLKIFDIKTLRTDEQGDIKILSDGKNYKIKTVK